MYIIRGLKLNPSYQSIQLHGNIGAKLSRSTCFSLQEQESGKFLGGLVVRIPGFHCHGPDSILGRETEILKAAARPVNKYIDR